jgi:peroxiredoxin
MNMLSRALGVAGLVVFLLSPLAAVAGAEMGGKAPQFVLPAADGELVSLKKYRGKPLVLHFWATWCPYCKKLQPGLQSLADTHAGQGLVVLGISFREDPGTKPQAVLEARGHSFMTLVEGDETAAMYGVKGTPTTFFINRKGRIVGKTHTSDPNDPVLESLTAEILK